MRRARAPHRHMSSRLWWTNKAASLSSTSARFSEKVDITKDHLNRQTCTRVLCLCPVTSQLRLRNKIHILASLSDTIYPETNSATFPTSSAQHTYSTYVVSTWSTSTGDIPHTSQSERKTRSHAGLAPRIRKCPIRTQCSLLGRT